ncbi:hypothetical protein OAE37_03565 [Pirellulaceae bacterium]|nr:hypothetical protein [Pirellulaceae bacterium]
MKFSEIVNRGCDHFSSPIGRRMSALAWKDPYYFESALNCTQIKGEDAGERGGFESPTKPESERAECIHPIALKPTKRESRKEGNPDPAKAFALTGSRASFWIQ